MNELYGLPPTLGRYELVGLLGRGGMGRVVRGHDPVLRRDVALKLIEPGAVDAENLDELRFLFHREARATASLRHPNIVEVFDYSGPSAEILFLACELIEGPTLFSYLQQHGALGPALVAALGYEIASPLVHAHARGIVHRDLKPENVFWTHEGRVVVSDFGIAKALDGATLGNTVQFGATHLYGSPSYIAPEQLTGAASPASDLYALGALLFELSTSEQAFAGSDVEAILVRVEKGERAPYPTHLELPKALVALIDDLLQVDPVARPSGDEVLQRLRGLLDDLEVSDPRAALRDFGGDLCDAPSALASSTDIRPTRGSWPTINTSSQSNLATSLFLGAAGAPEEVRTVLLERAPTPPKPAAVRRSLRVMLAVPLGLVVFGSLTAMAVLSRQRTPPLPAVVQEVWPPDLAHEVLVRVRVATDALVSVDEGPAQHVAREATFPLRPGKHRVTVERGGTRTTHDVLILAGTSPLFEL